MVLLQQDIHGGTASLSFFKDIVIDTTPPYVLNVASSKRNGERLIGRNH